MDFASRPEEVAAMRHVARHHLTAWGLHELVDTAQLCIGELLANVVTHVGVGTPGSLTVSLNGPRLLIEVRDPDTRALPTLVAAGAEAEGGRGMALVDALTDRWGVRLHEDHKVTWCELATGLPAEDHDASSSTRAEALLDVYATLRPPTCRHEPGPGRVGRAVAEESVVHAITDLLCWLHLRGCDAEEALDCAQSRFEAVCGALRSGTRAGYSGEVAVREEGPRRLQPRRNV
ncbi:ATP-binding protein [Streptomyces sp. bgisy022]|uniref:ATP-binding protein n=1 Tax=Streptomyces sp. bgisy022 TaxID=3413769 RepID=UPI003D751C27